MCEWLKQSVLKTDVRETVPGVRIPLPPPPSLDCSEFQPRFAEEYEKSPDFHDFFLQTGPEKFARSAAEKDSQRIFSDGPTGSPLFAVSSGEWNAIALR